MPVAESYTEEQLSEFMTDELGRVAEDLEYADFTHAIKRAQRLYGLVAPQTIADATDTAKLEACARLAAWEKAATDTRIEFDVNTDGQSLSLSQMAKQVREAFLDAQWAGFAFGINYSVEVTERVYGDDVYTWHEDDA